MFEVKNATGSSAVFSVSDRGCPFPLLSSAMISLQTVAHIVYYNVLRVMVKSEEKLSDSNHVSD